MLLFYYRVKKMFCFVCSTWFDFASWSSTARRGRLRRLCRCRSLPTSNTRHTSTSTTNVLSARSSRPDWRISSKIWDNFINVLLKLIGSSRKNIICRYLARRLKSIAMFLATSTKISCICFRSKLEKVTKESDPEHLEPFKTKMTTFILEATGSLSDLEDLVWFLESVQKILSFGVKSRSNYFFVILFGALSSAYTDWNRKANKRLIQHDKLLFMSDNNLFCLRLRTAQRSSKRRWSSLTSLRRAWRWKR